jgi:hypothetical protein
MGCGEKSWLMHKNIKIHADEDDGKKKAKLDESAKSCCFQKRLQN